MANTLIGSILVQPTSASPGQPVLVQVCDINGKPYTPGAGVTVTLQGVEATSRYYQFATPGTRKFVACAVKGNVVETVTGSVDIGGAPLMYRRTIDAPVQQSMPILQASLKLGHPYQATFRLSTPNSVQPILAQLNAQPPAGGAVTGTTNAAVQPKEGPAAFAQFSKALEIAPAILAATKQPEAKVTKIGDKTFTATGALGAIAANLVKTVPIPTSYKWDFGDGTTLTTQTPTATHDYFPAIKASKTAHNFDVSCTIVHDNITVKRTLSLISSYGLSKRLGSVVPHFTADDYAVFQHVGFSGTMIVHNIEPEPVTLNRMAVVPVSDDATVDPPAPKFVKMDKTVTIPANGTVGLGVYVTKDQLGDLGPKTSGFRVYYLGNTQARISRFTVATAAGLEGAVLRSAVEQPALAPKPAATTNATTPAPKAVAGVAEKATTVAATAVKDAAGAVLKNLELPAADVRFSHTFRIRLTDSGRAASLPKIVLDHSLVLKAVSALATDAKAGIAKAGTPSIDTATNTVAIPLSTNMPTAAAETQLVASVQAGLTSAALAANAIPASGNGPAPRPANLPGPPPPDPVIAAGNICDPDNISDADAQTAKNKSLACQLTDVTEQVMMPGSFQNALKGDVILSPGQDSGDNMIGALLRSLSPPQYHSHSGLMTQNYNEITHCTAAPDRLTASDNLTGIGGAGGVKPDILQFAWPGSITQTVDAAIAGERWNDPLDSTGNTHYTVSGFNPEPLGIEANSNFVLVYPMVVKPLPENEGLARPKLRSAADIARAKGARVDGSGKLIHAGGCYYSFYGYTKPEIAAGFTDPAPASAGWATGLSPTVCSGFVWLSMKKAGIPLVGNLAVETPAELSAAAVAQGATVGATTLDGLFYYSQQERQTAAQVLNSIIYNEALQHEGFAQYIPFLGTDIAQNIADQILNMFAYDDPNMYGSSAWQNSADANAVSPDNIMWWNTPYFGYAEQLQYLEPHVEQYTVSRWKHVTVYGTVSGKVTRQDTGAAVAGAHVSLTDSLKTVSGPDGHYSIPNVAAGSYNLKAWAAVTIGGSQIQIANGSGGPSGQGQKITTTDANPNQNVDVVLQGLPENYRRLDLQFQWNSDHGDANPWHNSGYRYEGPNTASIPLGPGSDGIGNTGSYTYSYDYDGHGLFRCEYTWTASLLEDLSVEVFLTAKMIDDGGGDVQTSYVINFNVPKDGQWSGWWISMEADGFTWHNGPAKITGTATNVHLTS